MNKTPMKQAFKNNTTLSRLGFQALVGGVISFFQTALPMYKEVRADQALREKYLQDNIAMRAQLDQTGQVLRHVAHEVEQGHLADSQLNFDETTAPPSHVARLETAKAAQEVAKLLPAPPLAPATSHAEAVQAEKLNTAEASPTIH